MSTLAAARADNFYHPKNYNPQKIPLKKSELVQPRPFKVVQGQRVSGGKVRYQTPFHVRCEGCQNMVAKGVRFNAIQTWVDNFHSTKIYEFRMKCPQCIQKFVVRTDPENCEYIYVSGAKRIFQVNDCTDSNLIRDEEAQKKIKQDPFTSLQNQAKDKQKYQGMQQIIQKLKETNGRGDEDFEINRQLRKQMRKQKQQEKERLIKNRQKNLFIPLQNENSEDQIKASQIIFKIDSKKIKKEVKILTERQKLKAKIQKLNPKFQQLLKREIVVSNKPISNSFFKK